MSVRPSSALSLCRAIGSLRRLRERGRKGVDGCAGAVVVLFPLWFSVWVCVLAHSSYTRLRRVAYRLADGSRGQALSSRRIQATSHSARLASDHFILLLAPSTLWPAFGRLQQLHLNDLLLPYNGSSECFFDIAFDAFQSRQPRPRFSLGADGAVVRSASGSIPAA